MRFGERRLVSSEIDEWLNGPELDKIVKVDVYNPVYPSMTLSGGAFLNESGLVLNGTVGNYASAPDSTQLSITGDLDIKVKVSMVDWTPSTQSTFAAKYTTGGQGGYLFDISTSGILRLLWSENGSTDLQAVATVATGIADGATKWVRATLDVNNGASQRVVKFYTSDDGESWVQLGNTITASGVTSIFDSSAIVSVGAYNNGSNFPINGTIYRVIIQSAFDTSNNTSSVVFDANFNGQQYGKRRITESSPNAATVTINTTASWVGQWTLPAGATFVKVCCVGGGGGGGSGAKLASLSARGGGSGGGSGGISFGEFSASLFTGPVTITLGLGGAGGVTRTVDSTSGAAPSASQSTTFGTYIGGPGGNGGSGGGSGNTSTPSASSGLYGSAGGQGTTASNGARGLGTILCGGGGGGAGLSTSDVAFVGGIGSAGLTIGSDVIAVRSYSGGTGGNGVLSGLPSNGSDGQFGCGGGGGGAGTNNAVNSGYGGNGGDGFCVVISYKDIDIQEFTSSGTWSKPIGNYTTAKIFVVGGGGGGGSGCKSTNGNVGGGGGGGGGGCTFITIPFSQLPNEVVVTVGGGGTGGASQTANNTDGNSGNAGGTSSFGSFAEARGGGGAVGGSISSGTVAGGSSGLGFSFNGGSGGSGGRGATTSEATFGTGTTAYTGGGGGGVGWANSGGNYYTGRVGGVGAAYTGAIAVAQPGANAAAIATVPGFYGGNGGGGGSSNSISILNGGSGAPKGGGGGGGATRYNVDSGAGGNGGDGYVCVVCI